MYFSMAVHWPFTGSSLLLGPRKGLLAAQRVGPPITRCALLEMTVTSAPVSISKSIMDHGLFLSPLVMTPKHIPKLSWSLNLLTLCAVDLHCTLTGSDLLWHLWHTISLYSWTLLIPVWWTLPTPTTMTRLGTPCLPLSSGLSDFCLLLGGLHLCLCVTTPRWVSCCLFDTWLPPEPRTRGCCCLTASTCLTVVTAVSSIWSGSSCRFSDSLHLASLRQSSRVSSHQTTPRSMTLCNPAYPQCSAVQ